jgi:hypothetical protein
MKLVEPDELDAFNGVLQRAGLSAHDFTLRQKDLTDPRTDEILALAGLVKITRKSTGVEREYPTGDGSRWVEEFERDLGEGLFEAGARESGPP